MADSKPVKPAARFILDEAPLLKEAAKSVLKKNTVDVGTNLKGAGQAFKSETTASKMTIIGGISSGLTLGLSGLRSIRNGLTKDEDGKRDYGLVALGAAETAGGGFVAAMFWERLQANGGINNDRGPGV